MGRNYKEYIVLDTGIWVKGLKKDEYLREAYIVLQFMNEKDVGMAVDEDGLIFREYRDNFPRNCREKRNFELWMKQLFSKQKIRLVNYRLTDEIKADLVRVKFHEEEDWVFIGTALNSDKIIVSEDSDYGIKGEKGHEEAFQYLTGRLALRLYSSSSYVNEMV